MPLMKGDRNKGKEVSAKAGNGDHVKGAAGPIKTGNKRHGSVSDGKTSGDTFGGKSDNSTGPFFS